MSKPLELDIWFEATCVEAGHKECRMERECPGMLNPRTGIWIEAGMEPLSKHLYDAELAAEVWHSNFRFMCTPAGPDAAEEARRGKILDRFAATSHAILFEVCS